MFGQFDWQLAAPKNSLPDLSMSRWGLFEIGGKGDIRHQTPR